MKKIILKNVKEELIENGADKSTIELILNNVILYNDLLIKYNEGDISNTYLLYQLNNQIIKQKEGVKRMKLKENVINNQSEKYSPVEALKNRIEKR